MLHQLAPLPLLLAFQLTILWHTALCDDTADTVVSEGYTSFPDIGVGYKYFDMDLSWEEARDHCIAEGGNLAIIDSIEKLEHVKSLAPLGETRHWLVGIHKKLSDSEWISVKTGLPLPYIPWRTNEDTNSVARCVGLVTDQDGLQLFDCHGWSHLCELPIESIFKHKLGNRLGGGEPEAGPADTPLSTDATVLPEGYTDFPDIGVAYKYYSKNFTWYSARKHCIADGGNLAVIDSLKKVEHASSNVPEDSPTPFVGVHRLFDHSEWVNVKTGLPVTFVPWKGDANLSDPVQLCVGLWTTGVSPVSCDTRGSYMCEVPMFKSLQKSHNKPGHKPSPKSVSELPSGYAVFPDLGVAYKYYSTGITWNGARKYCATHGANLAVIDSYQKLQCVIGLKTASTNVHVGVHRLFDDGEWIDVKDGSPATAVPWRATSYETEKSRKCMSLSTYGDKNGLFANNCDATEAFVCELSIFRN